MKAFFRKVILKLFSLLDIDIKNIYDRNLIISSQISKKAKLYGPYKINHSKLDDYTYISKNSHLNYTSVGKFCSIGPNLMSGWGLHPLDSVSTSPMFYSNQKQNGLSFANENKFKETMPIVIGNDVFIGMNVIILDGVTIGDGAVIGAGTVVSKDVRPYEIVVGAPMKSVRFRFSDTQIDKLLSLKWWNWSESKLKQIPNNFFDIEKFLHENRND